MEMDDIKKKAKELTRNFIVINIGAVVLGIILVLFPDKSKDIICRAVGIMLCIGGILSLIEYVRAHKQGVFGSFGLVRGCAFLGFGIYIIVLPDMLAAFITAALSIILFICGVFKLQNAIDFAHIKSKGWIGQVIAAVIMIAAAVLSFFNPFGASNWLMIFIGISLIVSGAWDIVSILYFNRTLGEIKGDKKPRKRKNSENSKYIDVEVDGEEDGE